MNVRELCRLLGETLHVPGIERWAARLVRQGLLPRSGHEVDAFDAAVLLLAIMAAPRPADAARAVVTVAGLPLISADNEDVAAMFRDPLVALAAAIEEAAHPEGDFLFGSLKVQECGVSAELHGYLTDGLREYRTKYAPFDWGSPTGISRFIEIHADAIETIAAALWPPVEHTASHDESTIKTTIH